MAIAGVRRLTFRQQESRGVEFRGRALALEIRGPKGLETRAKAVIPNLATLLAVKGVTVKACSPNGFEINTALLVGRTASEIDDLCEEMDNLFPVLAQAAAARKLEIELPEMIDISERVSIMKREVTVGLFKQVMQGYEITGHNADELQAVLNDPSQAGNSLTYVSLTDAREFATRLSNSTGRKFRVQTEGEWEQAREQLSGDNWTWTETSHPDYQGSFVLRHLGSDDRVDSDPGSRGDTGAVRLVEDLPVRQAGK